MTAPEVTATEQLAEWDRRIDSGEQVDAAEYVLVRCRAELERRGQAAQERFAAHQDEIDRNTHRRNNIENVKAVVPVAVSEIQRKAVAAVDALAADEAPGQAPSRLLYPGQLRAVTTDLSTLVDRLLAALEAGGAPNGTSPARDVLSHAFAMRDDCTVPWSEYLDIADELTALETVVRAVAAEF